jgi:uncharacterized membrane protein/ribosomal protein S27E
VEEPEAGKLLPKIEVTAESLNDTADTPTFAMKEVIIEINPTVDIELQVDKIKKDVTPNLSGTKAEVSYDLTIYNRGLDGDTFDISETNNHGFLVEISPTTTNKIDPDSSAIVNVKIVVDNNAPLSTLDYNTTIKVTSRTNDEKFEIITLKTRIKQTYGWELQVYDDNLETEDTISGNNRIVTFMVDVQNIGTGPDTCKLEIVSGDYSSWATLSKSFVTKDSKDNETFLVKVRVPRETSVEDYTINIKATSRGDDDQYDITDASDEEALTVSVTQFYEIKLDAPDSLKTGVPGDSIEFTITVTNRGNGKDTVDLTRNNYNRDWLWTLNQKSFTLEPVGDSDKNDKRDIKLSVDIPTDIHGKQGYYNISIFVYSTNTPSGRVMQNDNSPLIFTVKVDAVYEVDLILDFPTSLDDQKALPGKKIDYKVTLKNKGNTIDTFRLTLIGTKSGWVNLIDTSITISAYKSRKVNFTVEIPDLDEADLEDIEAKKYQITLKATSEGDSDETDELILNPTVDKEYKIDLEPDLDLDSTGAGTITVNPNADPEYETFTLTIFNKGNTPDNIRFTTKGVSDWRVTFKITGSSTLSLDIDRSESITVEVYAPSDAENGDTKSITIQAKSNNDEITGTFIIKATVETADIVFKTFSVEDDAPVGSQATVKLTVANNGDVDAEDVEIKFYDRAKNELIHTEKIDKLNKKDEVEIQFDFENTEGEHKIEATTTWSDSTIKKTQSFTSETELFDSNMIILIMGVLIFVFFIIGVALASASSKRGIPADLKEEIAMAKQAKRMGKSPSEIQDMRKKRLEKGTGGATFAALDRKRPGMKPEDEGMEEKEKPAKKPGKVVKIKCPECDKVQIVTSTKRPIEFPCSDCGRKLVLKK